MNKTGLQCHSAKLDVVSGRPSVTQRYRTWLQRQAAVIAGALTHRHWPFRVAGDGVIVYARPMGARSDPLVADGFGEWIAKVIDVFDREHWRLLLIQLVVCVPFWALAGWILTDVVGTTSFISFLAWAHVPGLLDVEIAVGPDIQMSIIGYYLGPDAVAADITTILTVESFSFALCASLCLVTLRAAGRHVTVITGLRLAARRVWPVLGWPLVGLAVVVIGFQVPLFADFFLGTPLAILVSTAVGIQLTTVFAASLVGVITFERAGLIRCFELIAGGWWRTFARLLLAWLIAVIYGVALGYLLHGSASAPMPAILQLTLWGLLFVPIGVLASAVHIVTYAELSAFLTTEELASRIAPDVDTLPSYRRRSITRFDRPEFGIVFDYPTHMREATVPVDKHGIDHPGPRTATVRLALDPQNGITLNRQELGELFSGRDPRAIRRAVDQFMTGLAGSPVRGTGITAGGLPAFEYEFAYSASAVPNLRSHSFVLIDGTTRYLINCESTDSCRHDMARATEVVLRSLRHR